MRMNMDPIIEGDLDDVTASESLFSLLSSLIYDKTDACEDAEFTYANV